MKGQRYYTLDDLLLEDLRVTKGQHVKGLAKIQSKITWVTLTEENFLMPKHPSYTVKPYQYNALMVRNLCAVLTQNRAGNYFAAKDDSPFPIQEALSQGLVKVHTEHKDGGERVRNLELTPDGVQFILTNGLRLSTAQVVLLKDIYALSEKELECEPIGKTDPFHKFTPVDSDLADLQRLGLIEFSSRLRDEDGESYTTKANFKASINGQLWLIGTQKAFVVSNL